MLVKVGVLSAAVVCCGSGKKLWCPGPGETKGRGGRAGRVGVGAKELNQQVKDFDEELVLSS